MDDASYLDDTFKSLKGESSAMDTIQVRFTQALDWCKERDLFWIPITALLTTLLLLYFRPPFVCHKTSENGYPQYHISYAYMGGYVLISVLIVILAPIIAF